MNFQMVGVLCEFATVIGRDARAQFFRPWFESFSLHFLYERVWNSYVEGPCAIFFCFENQIDVKLLTNVETESFSIFLQPA